MDVVLLLLKDKGKIILSIISNVLVMFFALFVIRYGYDIASQLLSFGQKSPANQIPMGLVYMATPIGMGLTLIRLIQNLIKQIKALRGDFVVDTEAEKI